MSTTTNPIARVREALDAIKMNMVSKNNWLKELQSSAVRKLLFFSHRLKCLRNKEHHNFFIYNYCQKNVYFLIFANLAVPIARGMYSYVHVPI